jgi:lysophospholipase L1-like esterase
VLEIYLNNERKFQVPVKKDRLPVLFQTHLGRLKKGDTIQVAVGLGDQCNKGGGRLCFVIEDYPPGENPGEPVNVYSPPMNVPSPQYGPDGRYVDYLKKHQAQCDAVISNKADLVFIGDSITARWPSELLQARYGKHRPVNLGIGGDWIQNVLWRVLHGVLGKASPKVIVLLIGTNNLGGFTPDEVAEGIGRLLRMIHEQTPASKILVLGILPRGLSVRDPLNDKVREVNAKLAPMADGKTVFFLDVGHALVEPDGTISPAVMPDRLHVATPGFVRWLDAMGPTLDNLLAGRSQENP